MQCDAKKAVSSASLVLPYAAKWPQKSHIPLVAGRILESRRSKIKANRPRTTLCLFNGLGSLVTLLFALRSQSTLLY